MASVASELLGIGVATAAGFVQLAQIERKGTDVYFLPAHDEAAFRLDDGTSWNPHVSYHSSGQHHIKTYNEKVFAPQHRQRPGGTFTGVEPLYDMSVHPTDWSRVKATQSLGEFAEVFSVPESMFAKGAFHILSLHLIAPGAVPTTSLHRSVFVIEHLFKSRVPWIHASLWRIQDSDA